MSWPGRPGLSSIMQKVCEGRRVTTARKHKNLEFYPTFATARNLIFSRRVKSAFTFKFFWRGDCKPLQRNAFLVFSSNLKQGILPRPTSTKADFDQVALLSISVYILH